jgi:hypothetical protein
MEEQTEMTDELNGMNDNRFPNFVLQRKLKEYRNRNTKSNMTSKSKQA